MLADNGIHFTTPGAGGSAAPLIKEAIANGELFRAHAFELALAEAGIEPSVGRVGDSYDNALAEIVRRQDLWPRFEVEI
ncbi:hypothetical protein [Starkeya sp. HF14-78462]|uniref:hypothetical protein n=1 Tax=Starkeya nomas TaxID=2666134 RepID=UPI00190FB451